ncbi:Fe-S oxidoreductase [Spirochaetia bacterium]|nr:Fe-S oxidoreductase [Spirochaetia bacterium]
MIIEEKIQQKAYELGIHKCGIIKPEAMLDYADRLQERIDHIPNLEMPYKKFLLFSDVKKNIPWAKSIIVLVSHYGHYRVPKESITEHYGKYYLVDSRFNQDSPERQKIFELENYVHDLGIKTAWNEHPGITAMRWAAYKAGLGIIRRNNFFYTEKGSWVTITALAADREMERIEKPSLSECSDTCNKCITACPTKSLSAPYVMNMTTCVSPITTSNDKTSFDDETNRCLGKSVYGCDVCQNVCPQNANKWENKDTFPGLMELAKHLSPEAILTLNYEEIEKQLSQKFFYIKKESLWRWKTNAINAMVNDYREDYGNHIRNALEDEFEMVREKAQWALQKLGQ